jgi:hypothetical protein
VEAWPCLRWSSAIARRRQSPPRQTDLPPLSHQALFAAVRFTDTATVRIILADAGASSTTTTALAAVQTDAGETTLYVVSEAGAEDLVCMLLPLYDFEGATVRSMPSTSQPSKDYRRRGTGGGEGLGRRKRRWEEERRWGSCGRRIGCRARAVNHPNEVRRAWSSLRATGRPLGFSESQQGIQARPQLVDSPAPATVCHLLSSPRSTRYCTMNIPSGCRSSHRHHRRLHSSSTASIRRTQHRVMVTRPVSGSHALLPLS